ncbi:MAG: 2-amino-4-hydroxy-6-hydroxymethyldihydropteridine diphosphokinase [Firmicutes bacterium]|nr:2-amino-4-hydroxy-6-hydroxymethyldihydropteridine diphosphokinase [Bacillota bacterium]
MMQLVKRNLTFIGLGGNLGDPALNLKEAVRLLEEKLRVELTVSPIYRSEPVGVKEQPWFLNQAACFSDEECIGPLTILSILKEIETQMGRIPTVRFGPRLIDLDLLFYDNWVFNGANLVIPHPRFFERSFVLLPLLDLNPDFIDPRSQRTLQQIWEENSSSLTVCQRTGGMNQLKKLRENLKK